MKIYVGHANSFDYKNELYTPLKGSILYAEHELIFPHDIFANAKDFPTKEILRGCDLMVAEVSFSATGLGIELGRAELFEVPIVCLHLKGVKVSNSLKLLTSHFISYETTMDMVMQLEQFVSNLDKNLVRK